MGDIVNLNKARKGQQRAERGKIAEQNRATFGESKAAKAKREAEAERLKRVFDGHRRTYEADPGKSG